LAIGITRLQCQHDGGDRSIGRDLETEGVALKASTILTEFMIFARLPPLAKIGYLA
jgi:hypothetical protein